MTPDQTPDKQLPLRPNVCMLVYNSEGKLLLGERYGEPGIWQFPQGGVKKKQNPEQAVITELTEELGAPPETFRIEKKLDSVHEYEFNTQPDYAKDRWRGQSQTFWLVEFSGDDSQIDLAVFDQEFSDWKWCSIEEVRSLAEPIRLPGYEGPLREFEEFIK